MIHPLSALALIYNKKKKIHLILYLRILLCATQYECEWGITSGHL